MFEMIKKTQLPSLELSLLFNLMFYENQEGWKSFREIVDLNKVIKNNIKQIEIKNQRFPEELIWQTLSKNNIPKYLDKLQEKGFIEACRFEEEDKRKRHIIRKKWRIKRTLGQFNKTLEQFDRFAYNEVFFEKIKISPFSNQRQITQDEAFKEHYKSKEYKEKIKQKYALSLWTSLHYAELIYGKVDLQQVINDLKKEYDQNFNYKKMLTEAKRKPKI